MKILLIAIYLVLGMWAGTATAAASIPGLTDSAVVSLLVSAVGALILAYLALMHTSLNGRIRSNTQDIEAPYSKLDNLRTDVQLNYLREPHVERMLLVAMQPLMSKMDAFHDRADAHGWPRNVSSGIHAVRAAESFDRSTPE